MIIIRTPFRVSFFGGGTDYPTWYRENGGAVLSTSINKYSFLTMRKLPKIFDYNYRIRYYEHQEVSTLDEITVPVIREAIKYMGFTGGLDIMHHGDLPNRTGIGSSSSFTVGLIHGLSVLQNLNLTKRELAAKAIDLEQNILKEAVGSQDQVAAAFGGLNRIEFGAKHDFTCIPLHIRKKTYRELGEWMQVFFTSKLRNSQDISAKKIANMKNHTADLSEFAELTRQAEHQLFMGNMYGFASMLNEQWRLKKAIEKSITNTDIDDIYDGGIAAGAIGGKLLGAGGGGFILFLTPPEFQQNVADTLQLKQVQVDMEGLGSQLIYHDYQDQED
ncbi:MAG: kinase [Bacteroidota bacterium]|jgi:D-glycero-alpha-D-manno-heptose-7-phosphate kinase